MGWLLYMYSQLLIAKIMDVRWQQWFRIIDSLRNYVSLLWMCLELLLLLIEIDSLWLNLTQHGGTHLVWTWQDWQVHVALESMGGGGSVWPFLMGGVILSDYYPIPLNPHTLPSSLPFTSSLHSLSSPFPSPPPFTPSLHSLSSPFPSLPPLIPSLHSLSSPFPSPPPFTPSLHLSLHPLLPQVESTPYSNAGVRPIDNSRSDMTLASLPEGFYSGSALHKDGSLLSVWFQVRMYVCTMDLLHQTALLTVLHHMQSAVQWQDWFLLLFWNTLQNIRTFVKVHIRL